MSDNNQALDIFLCRIGGDEWWFAETDTGDCVVRGEGATRSAALIDLASILSVSITCEPEPSA